MKKVRAAAVIAVVTTAVSQAREYAREHPDQAAQGLDKVEDFLRGRTAPKHAGFLDKGSAALRQGLGLPRRRRHRCRGATGAATGADAAPGSPTPTPTPPSRPRPTASATRWPPTRPRAPVTTPSRAGGTTTRHP